MLSMLASLGIGPDAPFSPGSDQTATMEKALALAVPLMRDYFVRSFQLHWPDRHWQATKPGKFYGFTFLGDGRLEYEHRAGGFAFWATWAPKRPPGDPTHLPVSYYLKAFVDAAGEPLRGDRLYRLRVPADTPARDSWSVIAYDSATNAFIHNREDRVGVSSYNRDQLTANDDGSIDVFVGPDPPDHMDANWIPTAGHDFWLVFRFYGPEPALFDRTWALDDLEPLA